MGREMGERGHGYTYGLFLLMCDRKPQNSVKQYPSITNTNKVAGKKKNHVNQEFRILVSSMGLDTQDRA